MSRDAVLFVRCNASENRNIEMLSMQRTRDEMWNDMKFRDVLPSECFIVPFRTRRHFMRNFNSLKFCAFLLLLRGFDFSIFFFQCFSDNLFDVNIVWLLLLTAEVEQTMSLLTLSTDDVTADACCHDTNCCNTTHADTNRHDDTNRHENNCHDDDTSCACDTNPHDHTNRHDDTNRHDEINRYDDINCSGDTNCHNDTNRHDDTNRHNYTNRAGEDTCDGVDRHRAMMAAMDVWSSQRGTGSRSQQRPPTGSRSSRAAAVSVNSCLARFTDRETLSGANSITCHACNRHATPTATANEDADADDDSAANCSSSSSAACSSSAVSNQPRTTLRCSLLVLLLLLVVILLLLVVVILLLLLEPTH